MSLESVVVFSLNFSLIVEFITNFEQHSSLLWLLCILYVPMCMLSQWAKKKTHWREEGDTYRCLWSLSKKDHDCNSSNSRASNWMTLGQLSWFWLGPKVLKLKKFNNIVDLILISWILKRRKVLLYVVNLHNSYVRPIQLLNCQWNFSGNDEYQVLKNQSSQSYKV